LVHELRARSINEPALIRINRPDFFFHVRNGFVSFCRHLGAERINQSENTRGRYLILFSTEEDRLRTAESVYYALLTPKAFRSLRRVKIYYVRVFDRCSIDNGGRLTAHGKTKARSRALGIRPSKRIYTTDEHVSARRIRRQVQIPFG